MSDLGPFQSGKLWLRELLGFEKDMLHVIIGLLVFVLFMLIFRRKPWHLLPVIAAIIAAIVGEAWDLYELVRLREKSWAEIPWRMLTHDLWVTAIVPVGIFFIAYALRPADAHTAQDDSQEKQGS